MLSLLVWLLLGLATLLSGRFPFHALCSPLDWILASWPWLTSSIFLIYTPLSGGAYPPVNSENGYMSEKFPDFSCLIMSLAHPYIWWIVAQIMYPKLKSTFTPFWTHFSTGFWFPGTLLRSPRSFLFLIFLRKTIFGFFSPFRHFRILFFILSVLELYEDRPSWASSLFDSLSPVLFFQNFYSTRGRTSRLHIPVTFILPLSMFCPFVLFSRTVPQLYVPTLLWNLLNNLQLLFYNCI